MCITWVPHLADALNSAPLSFGDLGFSIVGTAINALIYAVIGALVCLATRKLQALKAKQID